LPVRLDLNFDTSSGCATFSPVEAEKGSIPVMLRLVGAFDGDAEMLRLFLGQLRQLHADLFQVQPGDFFVELLGQVIDRGLIR
jgi:hypothetical protein